MIQTKGKIYFVSDVHLGAPALKNNKEREKLFVRWLDGIKADASALFLMGDIFDFWFEYRKVVPRGFTRTLGKIAEIADSGIPVHYFTGNHDIWIFDYLPDELGIILHREEYKTEFNGKKFFLAHGDGLDPSDKGYLLLKKVFTSKILQWTFARLHPNFAFFIGHNWSKNSRIANGIQADGYRGDDKEGLFLFAESMEKKEHFDYFIFGHRHLLVERPIGGKSVFINLGDWINYFSYGVFDGEKMELKKYNIQQ
ncbi:MAG: UDP-2,3-diacylglucosamine diphosphatase [Prolixibacteraceae bacterium]|nr:UDP-2,3-diacylglucosamine diphosphatase [Prolixibacteraceae bacterium]